QQGAGVSRRALPGTRRAFRKDSAQHASLGGPLDGDWRLAAHVPSIFNGLLQEAARIQLEYWRAPAGVYSAAFVHGISAARRPTRILGCYGGDEHGPRHSAARA